MEISRYLAMTGAEMEAFSLPEGYGLAYMACMFSRDTTGLSGIPARLPQGSMLILNDHTPFSGHDPNRITEELLDAIGYLGFESLLLDFERVEVDACRSLCGHLVGQLPCPMGIPAAYARELDCPVFLPPPPLDQPLQRYIAPWEGREIWLDVAPAAGRITVTGGGSTMAELPFSPAPEDAFTEERLHCRYRTEIKEDAVHFHLWRDWQQVEALIHHAQNLGISKCIGLYQEFWENH